MLDFPQFMSVGEGKRQSCEQGFVDSRGRTSFLERKACRRRQEVSTLQTRGAGRPGADLAPQPRYTAAAEAWSFGAARRRGRDSERGRAVGPPLHERPAAPAPCLGSLEATSGTILRVCLSKEHAHEFGFLSFFSHFYLKF